MADFDPPFANANGDLRMPTADEIANGFGCGPADIDLFNGLINAFYAELGALLVKSGLTPSNADFQQVAKSIRSQRLNYVATVGGTANALTITLDPAPATNADLIGMPLRVKIGTTNTAAATLSANGLPALPVIFPVGGNLPAGALRAGAIVTVVSDGSQYQVVGGMRENLVGGVQLLTSASGSFTVPGGVYQLAVDVVAAGAGGGGTGTADTGAGGGGGGGYRFDLLAVTPGQVIAYTVGAGGVGTVSTGGNGGSSSFGTTTATGGLGGQPFATTPAGGSGGGGSGGLYGVSGCCGTDGGWTGTRLGGSGGAPGGIGGGSGRGGNGAGIGGLSYGAGGGGAYATTAGAVSGGSGASGVIIVKW